MILNLFLLPRKSEKMNVKICKLLPVYKNTLCKIAIGGYRDGCIGTKTWEKAWLCENLTFLFSIWLALRCWSIRSISYFTGNITPYIVIHCSHTILKSWSVRVWVTKAVNRGTFENPQPQSFIYTNRNCFIPITIEVKRIFPAPLTNFYYGGKQIVLDQG